MATGQELTPGQNAWSRGEEGKHAMATGQELTPPEPQGCSVNRLGAALFGDSRVVVGSNPTGSSLPVPGEKVTRNRSQSTLGVLRPPVIQVNGRR